MTKRQTYLNYKLNHSDRTNNVFESTYRRDEFQMKNGKVPNGFEEDRIDAHRRITL